MAKAPTAAKHAAATRGTAGGSFLERYFGLAEHGTTVRTEVLAGLTTFLTMAYIIFVNPNILAAAGHAEGRGVRRDLPRGGDLHSDHGALRRTIRSRSRPAWG